MNKSFRSLSFLLIACWAIIASSCIPHKRLINFQEETSLFETPDTIQVFGQVSIQPNDQLFIQVSGLG